MVFFMKELTREKLGTKLKLEVELDFRRIAGVLSCVYSQGEQKKLLSHGSVRGCCSYRTEVSAIRAWSSLPECVLTAKGCLIIYLSFWNSSVQLHVTVSWTYCDPRMWQADASDGWANSAYERVLSHEMAEPSCSLCCSFPAISEPPHKSLLGGCISGRGWKPRHKAVLGNESNK